MDELLRRFFQAYAARFEAGVHDPEGADLDGTMAAYADCFVAAGPEGVACGTQGDAFREQLAEGFRRYRDMGTKSISVRSQEIRAIDAMHAAVKVGWRAACVKPDGTPVEVDFDTTYLVQVRDGQPKVFGFVSSDEQRIPRAQGLLGAEAAK